MPSQNQNAVNSTLEGEVVTTYVKMKTSRSFVCVVNLKQDWQIKTKFKFTHKNCGLDKQKEKI